MRERHGLRRIAEPAALCGEMPTREWVAAALVFGLMLVEGLREGGFWRADAFVVAVAAVGFPLVATVVTPPDRRGSMVIVSILLLALSWLVRVGTSGSLVQWHLLAHRPRFCQRALPTRRRQPAVVHGAERSRAQPLTNLGSKCR
jgi:hypothetical protein